jgi:hypothetical protein
MNYASNLIYKIDPRLEVHYAPHVSLTSDRGDLLQEGDPVRFVCSAVANPAQVRFIKLHFTCNCADCIR